MHDQFEEPGLSPDIMGALPDVRPDARVETAVIRGLRNRGDLRPATHARRTPWLPRAIAAGVIFAVGVATGGVFTRANAGATASVDAAAHVRETAAEYIRALARVDQRDAAAAEAAMSTFRTASDQMLRIAPASELAVALDLAFPGSFVITPALLAAQPPTTRLIRY